MKKKVLIIEKINLFTFIVSILLSIKYEKVLIFESKQILNNYIIHNFLLKKIFIKFLKKKIFFLDDGINENFTFFSNKIGLDHLLKSKKFKIPFFLKKNFKKNIEKIYKKNILNFIQSKYRLYIVFRYLNKKNDCKLIECYKDYFNLKSELKINSGVTTFVTFFENFNFFIKSNLYIFKSLFNYIFINRFHFKKKPANFDIGYQLSNRGENEELLINELNNKKGIKVVFIKSVWKLDKKYYDSLKNLRIISSKNNSINIFFFFTDILKKILIYYFSSIYSNQYNNFISIKILKDFIDQEIFCQHYRIENFVSRDDYWESHGLRTIVQNKYKLKHIGIQHSAFLKPYGNSYICFDYFDVYIRYNKFNYNLYKNFSYSKFNKIVGNFTVENILKYKDIKIKNNIFSQNYANKVNILVTPPLFFGNEFVNYNDLFKKLEFINEILLNYKNVNFFIFIRKNLNKNIKIFFEKNKELKNYKDRIFFNEKFNTQELIIFSDIIIVSDTSTLAIETLSFNSNKILCVANFRFAKKKAIPWFEIDKKIIKQSSSEIYDFISSAIDNPNYIISEQKKILLEDLNLNERDISKKIVNECLGI